MSQDQNGTTAERDIEPAELREWANEYDDFDRRAGVLQATWTGGGAEMLRAAAAEIERLREAVSSTTICPWLSPNFDGWSIVGMNHYRQGGERFLFVAMTDGHGHCIQTEGPDVLAVWDRLVMQASLVERGLRHVR